MFVHMTDNGIKDAGHTGIPGLQIHLFDKATAGVNFHQHQLTDASGNYSFINVQPGEYILCEQGGPPSQTFPASDGSGGMCATHTGIAGSRGYDIVLTANQTITGEDFGNTVINVEVGSISGQTFNDLTGNGFKDAGDPGMQGIQIHVFDKATLGATTHLHTFSDVNGNFSFANVPVGEYIVCEQGGPPTQTFPTSDGSGGLCATHTGVPGSRGYDITVVAN